MKTKTLIVVFFAISLSLQPLWNEHVFALCAADINYDSIEKESELVFTGTATRLDNYDGPQKVTFFVHDVIKGQINTEKYVLENLQLQFLEDGIVMNSSTDVDYKVGQSYKVYVVNGETSSCTTKIIAPPDGYIWEPGPEDGNYYSDTDDILLQQYQNANERPSYRDALTSGSIVVSGDSPKLSDMELDDIMNRLFDLGLDPTELPIASIAIDYDRDILVFWTPDFTIEDKIKEIVGDTAFVLLYEEAPVRWEHDGPPPELIPEPEQDKIEYENCGPGTTLQDGICVVNSDDESSSNNTKWDDFYNEKYSSPNLTPAIDYDYGLLFLVVLLILGIGCGVTCVVFLLKRKNK